MTRRQPKRPIRVEATVQQDPAPDDAYVVTYIEASARGLGATLSVYVPAKETWRKSEVYLDSTRTSGAYIVTQQPFSVESIVQFHALLGAAITEARTRGLLPPEEA